MDAIRPFICCLLPLAFTLNFSSAADLSAAAICGNVAEAYKTLRVCRLSAYQTLDVPNISAHYDLILIKPTKIRLIVKGGQQAPFNQRLRLHLKLAPFTEGLTIVSDGETTWRYSAKSNQYTMVRTAIPGLDAEPAPIPATGENDPVAIVRATLIGQYIALPEFAATARIVKQSARLKVEHDSIDCYVLRIRFPQSTGELWIDKRRFLILRQQQSWKTEINGLSNSITMTLQLSQADIANKPGDDLFTFNRPARAIEVQTLR